MGSGGGNGRMFWNPVSATLDLELNYSTLHGQWIFFGPRFCINSKLPEMIDRISTYLIACRLRRAQLSPQRKDEFSPICITNDDCK